MRHDDRSEQKRSAFAGGVVSDASDGRLSVDHNLVLLLFRSELALSPIHKKNTRQYQLPHQAKNSIHPIATQGPSPNGTVFRGTTPPFVDVWSHVHCGPTRSTVNSCLAKNGSLRITTQRPIYSFVLLLDRDLRDIRRAISVQKCYFSTVDLSCFILVTDTKAVWTEGELVACKLSSA